MKCRFSEVLGKLDNIESLLKKHIIFVLLCLAKISQTLHVCGATMKFAYFFARNSGRRFTWVVCEIRSKHIRKNGRYQFVFELNTSKNLWKSEKKARLLRRLKKWNTTVQKSRNQKSPVKSCPKELKNQQKCHKNWSKRPPN